MVIKEMHPTILTDMGQWLIFSMVLFCFPAADVNTTAITFMT